VRSVSLDPPRELRLVASQAKHGRLGVLVATWMVPRPWSRADENTCRHHTAPARLAQWLHGVTTCLRVLASPAGLAALGRRTASGCARPAGAADNAAASGLDDSELDGETCSRGESPNPNIIG